jgi:cysteine-rich repeat protein
MVATFAADSALRGNVMRVSICRGIVFFGLFTLAACSDTAPTRSPSGSNGEPEAAGSSGGPCYPNGTCNSGLNCVGGYCAAPSVGAEGGPCYANSTCNAGLVCEAGSCATGITDTGSSDTGAEDTDIADTGAEDTGIEDTGRDTGIEDTGRDTGIEDTGGEDAVDDTGLTDTGPEDTGLTDTGPEDTTVGPTTDLCINAADRSVLAGDGAAMVTDAAQSCGLGCLGDADPGACAGACVATETGLSNGCAGCYAGVVVCSITNCLAPCAADPDSRACGDCQAANCIDEFNACTGTDSTGSGTADTGTEDTGLTDTGPEDTTVGPTTDLCINAADRAFLAGDGSSAVTDAAQACGLGCLGDADPGACTGDCVATETGLSNGCAGCYAGVVVCAITNCLAPCAADPDSRACGDCQAANCIDEFNACTGPIGTDPGDTGTTDTGTDTSGSGTGPACGDGAVDAAESCDDGNVIDGDGCSSICSICTDDAGETDGLLSARNIEPTSCMMGALTIEGLVAQSGNPDYFTFVAGPGTAFVSSLQAGAEGVSFDLLDAGGVLIQAGVASGTMPGLVELNYIPPAGTLTGGSFVLKANAEVAAECISYSITICTNQG